jgi:excisionase family DNA binding protein
MTPSAACAASASPNPPTERRARLGSEHPKGLVTTMQDQPAGDIQSTDFARAATAPDSGPRVLLTVEQAAERLSIGRSNMFKLLKTKQITSVRIGQLRRVPASEIEAYVERLIAEQNVA